MLSCFALKKMNNFPCLNIPETIELWLTAEIPITYFCNQQKYLAVECWKLQCSVFWVIQWWSHFLLNTKWHAVRCMFERKKCTKEFNALEIIVNCECPEITVCGLHISWARQKTKCFISTIKTTWQDSFSPNTCLFI